MSNGNGSGNHSDTSFGSKKLLKLLADAEETASAIRKVLGLLHGSEVIGKQRRAPDVIAQALAIDGERREKKQGKKHAGGHPRRTPGGSSTPGYNSGVALKRRRVSTAKRLQWLSKHGPVTSDEKLPGLGRLLSLGYVRKTADGYVRTEKEFVP